MYFQQIRAVIVRVIFNHEMYLHILNCTLLLALTFNFANVTSHAHVGTGKSRQRRLLIYPTETSYIQMVLGFGLPFEVDKQSITMGPFVKSLYHLPLNSSDYISPSIDIGNERRKRATSTRWDIYSTLSAAADFLGYGGKSCVLRAICEIAEIPFHENADIFTEISHVIFTPSSTIESVDNRFDYEYHAAEHFGKSKQNCRGLFPGCKVNLLEQFTDIFTHLRKVT